MIHVLDLRGHERDSYHHRWWVLHRDLGIGVEWLRVELTMLGLLKAKKKRAGELLAGAGKAGKG